MSSFEKVSPGMRPLFFSQKIAANDPEKKTPSTAAKATTLSPMRQNRFHFLTGRWRHSRVYRCRRLFTTLNCLPKKWAKQDSTFHRGLQGTRFPLCLLKEKDTSVSNPAASMDLSRWFCLHKKWIFIHQIKKKRWFSYKEHAPVSADTCVSSLRVHRCGC